MDKTEMTDSRAMRLAERLDLLAGEFLGVAMPNSARQACEIATELRAMAAEQESAERALGEARALVGSLRELVVVWEIAEQTKCDPDEPMYVEHSGYERALRDVIEDVNQIIRKAESAALGAGVGGLE